MSRETSVTDLGEDLGPVSGRAEERLATEEGEVSLLDFLIVLANRKRLILCVTVSCASIAIAAALILPKFYTATVTLLPPQQNSSSSLATQLTSQLGALGGIAALAAGGGGGNWLKNPNDLYVGMLKSRTVEDAMVEHFGLMQEYHKKYLSDARKKLEHYSTIDGSSKDGLIHLSVEDRDPRRAAELANGYVEQFRSLSENLAITEAGERRAFFEGQLKQANQNLANAEESLKETEQRTGLIQLDSQARALIATAAELRAEISAKEVQIQGMQTYATGENAQLIEAQRELDGLRAQLAKLGGKEDSLDDGIIVSKGQMTEAGVEYVRRYRDVRYYEAIFDILARQFELAKLDEAKEGAVIQVVDPAVPPDKKSSPQRILIVAVSTAVGFLIGILLALAIAGFERAKLNPSAYRKLHLLRKSI